MKGNRFGRFSRFSRRLSWSDWALVVWPMFVVGYILGHGCALKAL